MLRQTIAAHTTAHDLLRVLCRESKLDDVALTNIDGVLQRLRIDDECIELFFRQQYTAELIDLETQDSATWSLKPNTTRNLMARTMRIVIGEAAIPADQRLFQVQMNQDDLPGRSGFGNSEGRQRANRLFFDACEKYVHFDEARRSQRLTEAAIAIYRKWKQTGQPPTSLSSVMNPVPRDLAANAPLTWSPDTRKLTSGSRSITLPPPAE